MTVSDIETEVREHKDRPGTYYVFWTHSSAYGLRGNHLTLAAAEALAARVRDGGPSAA